MAHGLEIRRSSASLWGEKTGLRKLPVVAKYIDTTTCIGCKACEVACQEWNDLKVVPTQQTGTYQTLPSLTPDFWNLIKFSEREAKDGGFLWLMRKDQCMHCEEPGCLAACPAPGAIVQYENGIVDVDPTRCIGCGYCLVACPYGARYLVPAGARSPAGVAGVADKCTFCYHRITRGRDPACVEICPVGARLCGDLDDPDSNVSTILRDEPTRVMKPELGTRPRVHYLGLEGEPV
jgi:formate dehydrogenase beta subunit